MFQVPIDANYGILDSNFKRNVLHCQRVLHPLWEVS